MTPRTTCVFCGGGPLTKEHLWPEWLRKRGVLSKHPVQHIQGQEPPAEPWERSWSAPDATQGAEIVCKDCNTGWMSKLETASIPCLLPLMTGDRRPTLSVEEQSTIALWATKMAMVWQAIHPYVSGISDEDYAHVFKWRSPPPGWRIWIAAYGGSAWSTYCFEHPLRLRPAEVHKADPSPIRAEDVNGHLSTFGVRAFVFQVFGAQLADVRRPAGLHEARFSTYLRSVWPAEGFVNWPPDATLTDSTFAALADGGLAE